MCPVIYCCVIMQMGKDSQDRLMSLGMENEHLKLSLKTTTDDASSLKSEIQRKNAMIDGLKSDIETLKMTHTDIKHQRDELDATMKDRMKELESVVKSLEREVADAIREKQMLEKEQIISQKERNQIEEELSNLRRYTEEEKKRLDGVVASKEEVEASFQKSEMEVEAMKELLERSEVRRAEGKETIDKLRAVINELEAKIKERDKEWSKAEGQKAEINNVDKDTVTEDQQGVIKEVSRIIPSRARMQSCRWMFKVWVESFRCANQHHRLCRVPVCEWQPIGNRNYQIGFQFNAHGCMLEYVHC